MLGFVLKEVKVASNRILAAFFGRSRKLIRLRQKPRYTSGVVTIANRTFSYPDSDSFSHLYTSLFLEEIYRFDTASAKPYIIDCGANIGVSVRYFNELYPQAKIVAFEPERKIFDYLRKNVDEVESADIELVNKAVWSKDEFLTFHVEGADSGRVDGFSDVSAGFQETYQVPTVRLSNYIDQEVDLLKIDIEGAELEVLREIEPKLSLVKRLFVEYHSFVGKEQHLDELLLILTRNGFRYYIDSPSRMKSRPFLDNTSFLSMDFFLHVFATRSLD